MTRKALLLGVIQKLNEQDLSWVLVGDTRNFPEIIHSDADFVVSQKSIHVIPSLISKFADEQNVWLIQQLEHQPSSWSFVLAWISSEGPQYFILDFCGDYCRFGRTLMQADELLAGRVQAVDDSGRQKGFLVPSPASEFAYYLVKKVDKLELTPEHRSHLSSQWKMDPKSAMTRIARFWTRSECELIAEAAERNDWTKVAEILPTLQHSLRKHLSVSLRARWLEVSRAIRRGKQPTGLIIAVLGPDGSGKSSLLKRLSSVLLPAFRRTETHHFRPQLRAGRSPGQAVTNPYSGRPRAALTSTLKLFYMLAAFTVGYWIRIRPRLICTTLVLFDRYYHDMLVDPYRYRLKRPLWLARMLRHLIPAPDFWLILSAPPEVLQLRKQEVTFEESARQTSNYVALAATLPNARLIDATRSLDAVTRESVTAVLQHLAERQKQRNPS